MAPPLNPKQFGEFDKSLVTTRRLQLHQTVGGFVSPSTGGKNFPHDMLDTYPPEEWNRIARHLGYGGQN